MQLAKNRLCQPVKSWTSCCILNIDREPQTMDTFALLQVAVEYEDPHSAGERTLSESIPRASLHLVVGIAASTALLNSAASAQALMRHGDQGTGVRELQSQLNLRPDGIFGADTLQAVKRFQQRNGLAVDGIAGAKTLTALGLPATLAANGRSNASAVPQPPRPVSTDLTVNTAVLNVRSRPSRSAPVEAVLYQGTRVALSGATRSSEGLQWAQLSSGGWIASSYLSGGVSSGNANRPDNPRPGNDVIVPVAGTAYVASAIGVNVRNAPAGTVIESRQNGQAVSLTGARRFADGRYWVQIASGGWIAEEYLSFNQRRLS
jgi:uncharacterized protein YraI